MRAMLSWRLVRNPASSSRKFGYPVPLGIKRGHHLHFTMKDGSRLGHTVVDEEAGYVLAPMVQGVRLSTGIEFASPDAPANYIQLKKDGKWRKHCPSWETPSKRRRDWIAPLLAGYASRYWGGAKT